MPILQALRITHPIENRGGGCGKIREARTVDVSTFDKVNLRTHPKIILKENHQFDVGVPRQELAPNHRQIRASLALGHEPGLSQVSKKPRSTFDEDIRFRRWNSHFSARDRRNQQLCGVVPKKDTSNGIFLKRRKSWASRCRNHRRHFVKRAPSWEFYAWVKPPLTPFPFRVMGSHPIAFRGCSLSPSPEQVRPLTGCHHSYRPRTPNHHHHHHHHHLFVEPILISSSTMSGQNSGKPSQGSQTTVKGGASSAGPVKRPATTDTASVAISSPLETHIRRLPSVDDAVRAERQMHHNLFDLDGGKL
ncbi:uncharacterized protein BT62DRAFT_1008403 [Guyanagaster necrorhizus]|uniref:Uncharacterized protein n=1 Tax=Guyanagaster necrorhizus TaxID=856835 RepID=A0A9P8AQT3_9AGAR|nr:uncharacterized protein BT62DRAFT_1008403 [Guyanagaster necrorhizus MCA 3950]KAG7444201.1 hypothetical protein BT62DRAFT_1008403 [Guyanagaster necrorhizus MCA 3950]